MYPVSEDYWQVETIKLLVSDKKIAKISDFFVFYRPKLLTNSSFCAIMCPTKLSAFLCDDDQEGRHATRGVRVSHGFTTMTSGIGNIGDDSAGGNDDVAAHLGAGDLGG